MPPYTRIRGTLHVLLASLLLASFTASCATGGYWVPPSSVFTPQPTLAQLSETATPTLYIPPDPATPVPTDTVPPAATPEVTSPPLDLPPTETAAPPEEDPPAGNIFPVATTPEESGGTNNSPILYYAQAADTLQVVAVRFGVNPEEITSPEPIPPTSFINPKQLLIIPRRLGNTTSPKHLIPDSEVVFSPSATSFDASVFAEQAGGKLAGFREWHKSTGMTTGAQIIMRVATENSINPRLLLALLEYHSGWVYGQPAGQINIDYPLGYIEPNTKGLYNQLMWAVNQLSIGYYAYREGRLTEIKFSDGVTARLAPDLNAGTAALQYYFAKLYQGQKWLETLDPESGFPSLHQAMFGNPWERAQTVEPLFPSGIEQPAFILPFMRNWTWAYTGGPHGAWERDGAYAAVDFAPGSIQTGCVESMAWVTAAASGLVVRSGNGVVVLDLDGDGYETTGWVLLYLHVSTEKRVPLGTWVDTGDPLGHPSCEGGMSTGTHVHIARKYNGEWIPASGPLPFNLGGWVVHAGEAAYKGTLVRGDETKIACTCSSFLTHVVRTEDDP